MGHLLHNRNRDSPDDAACAGAGSQAQKSSSLDQAPSFPCAKLKLDQFFLIWLSEHQDTITSLLEDVKLGRPVRPAAPTSSSGLSASPLSPLSAHGFFAANNAAATPPLSPSKQRSPHSPLSPHRRSLSSSASGLRRPPLSTLPQFYFPSKVPKGEAEVASQQLAKAIDAYFAPHPNGLAQTDFVDVMHQACHLPKMVGQALFKRLSGTAGRVPKDALLKFWLPKQLASAPVVDRVFHCLKQENQQYLTFSDFQPLMDCVLLYHPGLEFLKETAEFQKKYAETVVYRIFYTLNRCGDGHLTLREIKRADLLEALELLDSEEDINKILKYFSYEHFYVIYCKFWELDQDHDFLIDRDDLAHYSQGALSLQVIDRVFEQVPRRFSSTQPGKMSYEDFVWFILSEEDKTSDTALEYWFRCVDLDCDGVIRPREMWFYYEEQLRRMENMPSGETVLFEDVVCQLHDMLHPEVEGAYTIRDLRRVKPQSGIFFNALFNLHKFLNFENRDPFAARAEAGEYAGLSEWDKFAKIEYYRLASEDDQEVQMEAEEGGGWPEDSMMM